LSIEHPPPNHMGQVRDLVPALAAAMSVYDPATANHSTRVAEMSVAMAHEIGVPDRELGIISRAANLHDLGKLSIPREILEKPSPLDVLDWGHIHRHPVVGADLVMSVSPRFEEIAVAIRDHHERWDGSGYPNQQREDEITLAGRILAVADAYDAMTNVRHFRVGRFTPDGALEELHRVSGSQLDPHMVEVFAAVFRSGRIGPAGP